MTLSKYKFEEIAINCTQKRFPTEEDQPLYIGLEHLDTGNLHVDRWGSPVPLKGEKLIMRKGDVLLGRRNAYLRRAAVAPHDGLFSAHGMVLQPREDVIDKEFFPLFIASDYFFDEANRISVGSLSPTINWKDLRSVEFEIPSMEKQRELAKVLWAMDTTKRSYQKLLQKTDELVKAQFMEQFGEKAAQLNNWPSSPLNEVIEKPLSGEWGKDDPDGTGFKVLRTTNFTDYGVIDYSDVVTRKIDEKRAKSKFLRSGDILIEKSGGSDTKAVGRVVIFDGKDNEYLFNNFTSVLRLKPGIKLHPVFLFEFLFVTYWNGGTRMYENKTTGIHNLKLADYLAATNIPLPPMELQEQFAAFVRQSNKSKFELQKSLAELTATYKKIVSDNLG